MLTIKSVLSFHMEMLNNHLKAVQIYAISLVNMVQMNAGEIYFVHVSFIGHQK
jgi:hypothetical protein